MKKVWLITGCSTGFGRELATFVLAQGYQAAVAARNTDDIKDIIEYSYEKPSYLSENVKNMAVSDCKKAINALDTLTKYLHQED